MWGQILGAAAAQGGNIWSTQQTNQSNENLAGANRDWQAYMSNTAHQREVEDLKKAGLNPVLSAGGNGASTPSGGAATLTAPQINMPEVFQAVSMDQNQQKIDLETTKAAADIAKKTSETDLTKMKKILAQKGMIRAELEGEASSVIKNMLEFMKRKWSPSESETLRKHKEERSKLKESKITLDPQS